MRLTGKLYAQHIGWHFKKHWQVQGRRVPHDTGALSEMEKLGIEVKNPFDILNPKVEHERTEIVGLKPKKVPEDYTHPNWHDNKCYIYGDRNLLLEGIPQAQILTNTLEINRLPQNIENAILHTNLPSSLERIIQNLIVASLVLDAEQVKLPKRKLVDRPAFNLPREYGISHQRQNRLLINKIIFECQKLAGRNWNSRRCIDNAGFKVSLNKDQNPLQFSVTAEKLITSMHPIEPVKEKYDGELPDLFPVRSTISIPKHNIYTTETFFPFSKDITCSHPHTILIDFNKEVTGHLHGSDVSATQFQSRTLLKAFAVAAARAKQLYGESDLDSLPKPIVLQSIQTDGRTFHFGVFQLNTLNINSSNNLRNYWFHQNNMDLFEKCGYKSGRPVLEGYNNDVFRYIYAFYNNS